MYVRNIANAGQVFSALLLSKDETPGEAKSLIRPGRKGERGVGGGTRTVPLLVPAAAGSGFGTMEAEACLPQTK